MPPAVLCLKTLFFLKKATICEPKVLFQHGKHRLSEKVLNNETNVTPGLLPNVTIAKTFDARQLECDMMCIN